MVTPHRLIDGCRTCGLDRRLMDEVFTFDRSVPLAGAFAPTYAEARSVPRYPLTWLHCPVCTVVNVAEDIPDEALFAQYNYRSSTIAPLVRHFAALAATVYRKNAHRRDDASMRVLEIGCNDGVLLNQLPEQWNLWGCDPSDVAREAANAHYGLINEPFEKSIHDALTEPFDLIIASNTLAHMTDIMGVLSRVTQLLKPDGEFIVEVHDLDATLATAQWDTIYHEHKVEWSHQSLELVMARHGLRPHGYERLRLHGGLIRMYLHRDDSSSEYRALRTQDFSTLEGRYARRYDLDPGYLLTRAPKPTFAYGAAGRATMWFNNMDEIEIQIVFDDSPARVEKFVPGTGTKIAQPGRMDDSSFWQDTRCVITAWNYADEIIKSHPEYRGLWLRSFN